MPVQVWSGAVLQSMGYGLFTTKLAAQAPSGPQTIVNTGEPVTSVPPLFTQEIVPARRSRVSAPCGSEATAWKMIASSLELPGLQR